MAVKLINEPVDERTTIKIAGTMKDETDTVIPAADVTTCTLTLYLLSTSAIINSKDDTNILNANNGTWSSAGAFTLELLPADNQMVGTDAREQHVALIEWTYASGTKAGKLEFVFWVRNMTKVS